MDTLYQSAREALLSRRAAIERGARERLVGSGAAAPAVHAEGQPASAPVAREGFSDAERSELDEIDAALSRIAKGSYGHCESCGHGIGGQRLRAVPETRHCRSCIADLQRKRS